MFRMLRWFRRFVGHGRAFQGRHRTIVGFQRKGLVGLVLMANSNVKSITIYGHNVLTVSQVYIQLRCESPIDKMTHTVRR